MKKSPLLTFALVATGVVVLLYAGKAMSAEKPKALPPPQPPLPPGPLPTPPAPGMNPQPLPPEPEVVKPVVVNSYATVSMPVSLRDAPGDEGRPLGDKLLPVGERVRVTMMHLGDGDWVEVRVPPSLVSDVFKFQDDPHDVPLPPSPAKPTPPSEIIGYIPQEALQSNWEPAT